MRVSPKNPEAGRIGQLGFAAILALALVLRLVWWGTTVSVIEAEGAEYAQIGENIFAGRGYVDLFGPNVNEAPLYPVLIGLASHVISDLELAARLISLVSGLLLVVALFRLARHLFGETAGFLSGVLAAAHPVLVGLSVSAFTESLSMALMMWGAYLGMRAIDRKSMGGAILTGVVIGLGYQARPELLLFTSIPLAVLGVRAIARLTPWSTALRLGAASFLAALMVAAPYIVYLSAEAGRFRWEGKSSLNEITNARMRSGMDYPEASHGIGASVNPEPPYQEGPYLTADQRVFLRAERPPVSQQLRAMFRPWRLRMTVVEIWVRRFLGAPAIVILAFLGFALGRWWRRDWSGGLMLAGFGVLQIAIFLVVEHHYDRYFFLVVPLLVPWAAAGIALLSSGVAGILRGVTGGWERTAATAMGVVGVLALSLYAYRPTRGTGEFHETLDESARAAGDWIRRESGYKDGSPDRPQLVSFGSATAFYSGALLHFLPYSDADSALEYIRRKSPDFISLRSWERIMAPYASDWVEHGIPSPCAEPAFQARSSTGATVRVWRWTCR